MQAPCCLLLFGVPQLNETTPFPQPKYRGAVGTISPLTKKWYVVDKINCRQTPIRLPSRNRWWVLIPQPTFLFAPFFPAPCRRWKPNRSAGVLETKGGSTEPVPTIDTTAPIMSIRHRLASIVDRELEKTERREKWDHYPPAVSTRKSYWRLTAVDFINHVPLLSQRRCRPNSTSILRLRKRKSYPVAFGGIAAPSEVTCLLQAR